MFLILLFLSVIGHADPVVTVGGREGVLSFQTTVFMPHQVQSQSITSFINFHTKHLLGILESPQFSKLNGLSNNDKLGGVGLGPLLGYRIVKRVESADGSGTELTYMVRHKVLVSKELMGPASSRLVKVVLPHDPVEFYARACTDERYYEKQYLFYYWNPFKKACLERLSGKNQVDYINAELRTSPENEGLLHVTPDYSALKKQVLERGELKIALLFGLDERSTDPNDNGRKSYEFFQRFFEKAGFKVERHRDTPTGPFAEYVRPESSGRFAVRISMSLSASDVNTPLVFARRAREAFENADIVDYVGHSGLGGNLDLAQITRLSSPDPKHPVPIHFPNFYQIYYIDSCASFFFYGKEYKNQWNGVHHVDLVTNGVATFFYTQNQETIKFLNPFINPQGSGSWGQIISEVESVHPRFTYLVNVNPIR